MVPIQMILQKSFYQHSKRKYFLFKVCYNTREKVKILNKFYQINVTLIPKLGKTQEQRIMEKHVHKYRCKNSN